MSDIAIPHDIEPHPLTRMYNGKFGVWLFLASEVMLFGALFSTYILLRTGAPEGTWPRHGSWILSVPLATINTMVLITSSVTMVMAWAALKMNNLTRARLLLLATFLLAATFMVIKYIEYSGKFHHYAVFLKTPVMMGDKETSTVSGHLEEGTPELTEDHYGGFVIPEFVEIQPDPNHGEHEHPPSMRIDKNNIRRLTNFGPSHSPFLSTYFVMTGLHGLHVLGGMIVILYLIITGPKMWKTRSEKYTNRVECTGLYWHFVDLVWIFLFPTLYLL